MENLQARKIAITNYINQNKQKLKNEHQKIKNELEELKQKLGIK